MNPYALSSLLAGISSATLGIFVVYKSPNRKLGLVWLLFATTVALYGFGAWLFSMATTADNALILVRLSYLFGVIWIASTFHHFVSVFLELKNRRSVLVNYCVSLMICFFAFKPYFFNHTRWIFDSMYYPRVGEYYFLYFIWWMALVVYSHYQLACAYRRVSDQKRQQIKYFFLATAIGFTGGCTAYLPNFGIEIYPWGNFAVCLYPFVMAYAIVKHRLMNIDIVIKRTIIYALILVAILAGYIAFVAHFTRRGINPLANFSILTSVASVLMCLFVLFKAPNGKIAKLWTLMCLSVAAWSFGFGMMCKSASLEMSLYWQKWFLYTGAAMIPVIFLHFVSLFVNARLSWQLWASYMAAAVFEVANFMGVLATAKPKPPFLFYTDGIFPIYHLYTIYFFVVVGYGQWLLFDCLRHSQGAFRNQVQYVALGTFVGFLGGCMTFPLSFNIQLFPIGTYLVVFYLVAVTYAIYKHHLLDINVVLRKSLVYSIMTGVLTAVYLVSITQGTQVLQSLFGVSTFATSVIAACIITIGFLPLRDRIQAFVDRYFFRDWSERGEMVRKVAAAFSHELKSPLAGLSMQAQMTLQELELLEKDQESLQDALPRIKEELHYLVNKAMDAARRIEAVRGVAEPSRGQIEAVQIPKVLENSLLALHTLVTDVRASVRQDIPSNLSPVRSNFQQLEIVFINLMKNALESMDGCAEPRLSLVGSEFNGMVQVVVQDTGAGISTKDLDRLFEPHYTTKGRKGTGMGLFLSQQIIKAHGGSIDVLSEAGKGTEFIVRLPKYSQEAAA